MSGRGYRKLLWGALVVLLVLWGVGLATGFGGNYIHVLLVLAVIVLRDAAAPASGVKTVQGPLSKPLDPPR